MKRYITLVSFMLGICVAPNVPIRNSVGTDLGSVSLVITERGGSLYSEAISPEANACHEFKFIDSNDPEGPAIIEIPFKSKHRYCVDSIIAEIYVNDEPNLNSKIIKIYGEGPIIHLLAFRCESMFSGYVSCNHNFLSKEDILYQRFFNNPTFIDSVFVGELFIPIPRTQDIVILQPDFILKTGSSIYDLLYIIRKIKTDWERILASIINEVELAQLQDILPKYMNKKFGTYPGKDSQEVVKLIQEYRNSEVDIDCLREKLEQKFTEYCKEFEHDALDCCNEKLKMYFKIKHERPKSLTAACEQAKKYLESQVSSAT